MAALEASINCQLKSHSKNQETILKQTKNKKEIPLKFRKVKLHVRVCVCVVS